MDAVLQRAINKMEAGSRGVSAETNDDQDSEAEAHHDSDTAAAHSLGTAVKGQYAVCGRNANPQFSVPSQHRRT